MSNDNNYKDSELVNYLSREQVNYLYNTDININTDICELIEQVKEHLQEYGITDGELNETGLIDESIIKVLSSLDVNKKLYRCVFVDLYSDNSGKLYCYKSDLSNFLIGDDVYVETKNGHDEGIVRRVSYYTKENLPYSFSKMKKIIEITDRAE